MYIVSVLIWPFLLISDSYFFMIPVLVIVHMLTGISAAGVNLCTGNIALKAAPRGKATAFLAVNTLVHGVAAATSPILGGIVADNLTGRHLALIQHWLLTHAGAYLDLAFSHLLGLHSLFYLTAIIGLYSMRRLRTVHEEGEVKGQIVVAYLWAETGKAVRRLFTSSRVRRLPRLPSAPAEQTVRRPKPGLGVVDP